MRGGPAPKNTDPHGRKSKAVRSAAILPTAAVGATSGPTVNAGSGNGEEEGGAMAGGLARASGAEVQHNEENEGDDWAVPARKTVSFLGARLRRCLSDKQKMEEMFRNNSG